MDTRVESRTARLFALSPDMVCVAGFDGYFKELNPAWTHTLGWGIDELTSRPFIDFVHPDDRASTESEAANIRGGATTIRFENRYRCRDGSYRWLLWSSLAVPDEEVYYAVARDITERKAWEEELRRTKEESDRANAAKSEFLSRMTHELRTPLTAILGFSQLLEMGTLAEEAKTVAVRQIHKAGQHLLALINEVLDIARVESGRIPLSIEPVPATQVIDDVEDLIRPLAEQRRITLLRKETDPATHVLADRQRLKQVLLNLLSNAVKYSAEEGTVTVRCEDAGEGFVRFSVTDAGPGIPADKFDRLFQPFERLGAEAGDVEGTGIGLALSKRLVELMDGGIGVQSDDGSGSTFWVDLPITEAPLERHIRMDEGALPTAGRAAGTRVSTVLLIEDNVANVRLVEYVLAQRPGATLIPVMQGRMGIDLARRHRPDLILLDLNLPDLAGLDVLRELKASTETAAIPVLVISADATETRRAVALAAGADAYLTKPLDVQRFMETIDELLEQEGR
jgi:PAS domain S-box-containing protein